MALLVHGSNADCPKVQAGFWSRCHGHIEGDAMGLKEERQRRVDAITLLAGDLRASIAVGASNAAPTMVDLAQRLVEKGWTHPSLFTKEGKAK